MLSFHITENGNVNGLMYFTENAVHYSWAECTTLTPACDNYSRWSLLCYFSLLPKLTVPNVVSVIQHLPSGTHFLSTQKPFATSFQIQAQDSPF